MPNDGKYYIGIRLLLLKKCRKERIATSSNIPIRSGLQSVRKTVFWT